MPVISSAIFSDWGELFLSYSVQLLENLVSRTEIWEHWYVSGTNLYILLFYESTIYFTKMKRTDYVYKKKRSKWLSLHCLINLF